METLGHLAIGLWRPLSDAHSRGRDNAWRRNHRGPRL